MTAQQAIPFSADLQIIDISP